MASGQSMIPVCGGIMMSFPATLRVCGWLLVHFGIWGLGG